MSPSEDILLQAENISKSYPMAGSVSLEVLHGIHLRVRKSEILAITGESGAGKSTLLHILGALDRPSTGRVLLDGADVFTLSDPQLARYRNHRIGFVFQFHHLLPEFSALENIAMPGLIARRPAQEVQRKAKDLLEEVGLSTRGSHKPRELSGGEQQRVAFARALMNDPLMVLADEPSGNLDLKNSDSLHELMWRLMRDKGISFVVVTHNQDLAERADRAIRLRDGRITETRA